MTFLQSLNFCLINIVLSITNKIWSCDSDYIVDVVSFIRIQPEKAIFLRGVLCSSSIIWNWHRYGLEIFTSVAKLLESNSYVCRSYWGKTNREVRGFLHLPPLPSFPPNLNNFDKLDSFGNANVGNFDVICFKMLNYYNSFSKSEILCYATSCVFFVL